MKASVVLQMGTDCFNRGYDGVDQGREERETASAAFLIGSGLLAGCCPLPVAGPPPLPLPRPVDGIANRNGCGRTPASGEAVVVEKRDCCRLSPFKRSVLFG